MRQQCDIKNFRRRIISICENNAKYKNCLKHGLALKNSASKIFNTALLVVGVLCGVSYAAGLGAYSGGFERIPLTTEAWARGNAVSANPEYAAAHINPAKLGFVQGFQLSFGNTIRPLGRYENFLSAEYKIPDTRIGVGGVFAYRGISNLDGLRYEGEIYNSTSFINTTLKLGVGAIISRNWSMGFSATWFYSRMPVAFIPDSRDIKTNTNSTIGGLTLMAKYRNHRGFTGAIGIRDIFSYSDWSYKEADELFINTIMDTMPMLFVAAAEYEFTVLDTQTVKVSADFNGYWINSFFQRYEHVALSMNYGFEWSPNKVISFRTGIRDILLNRNFFADRPTWRDENNPRIGFGVGVNLETIPNWNLSRKFGVNYAVANSGAQAGLEHSVDLVFRW
ncbi:MAG: hypothetical protein FWE23_02750 [Chitinivibrionia bacterium]|nr:hypothetical protein [Chitinivibrionia bacterium]